MTEKRVLTKTRPWWPPDLSAQPPELRGDKCLLFEPCSLWYLLQLPELR